MSTCIGQPVLVFRPNYLRLLKMASVSSAPLPLALGKNYEFVKQFSLTAHKCVQLPRISVDIADSATESFKKEDFKAKRHPGVLFRGKVCLPEEFIQGAKAVLLKSNIKSITSNALEFKRYLESRRLPIEDQEYRNVASKIEAKIRAQDAIMEPFLSAAQLKGLEDKRFHLTKLALKKRVYHWEAVNYVGSRVLDYLMVRSDADYGALYKIFSEISTRDPDFQPNSLLDFGSGVGTVQWAANAWWNKSLNEHVCVDSARDMSDVAELILRGGNPNKQMIFPNTFYRQFLPTTHTRRYDLVTCAYSLLELPSAKSRIEVLNTLWRKSANYIVLIEYGNMMGFKLINEARDFLLQLDQEDAGRRKSHAFSPCPHDTYCPRYLENNHACNFFVHYRSLLPFGKEIIRQEKYAYCVIKRGPRDPKDPNWPRLVDKPLKRSRHVICRACMPEGKLSEIVLTKSKNSTDLYKSGRKSRRGDLLPIKEIYEEKFQDNSAAAAQDVDNDDSESQYNSDDDSDLETDSESDSEGSEPSGTSTSPSLPPQDSNEEKKLPRPHESN